MITATCASDDCSSRVLNVQIFKMNAKYRNIFIFWNTKKIFRRSLYHISQALLQSLAVLFLWSRSWSAREHIEITKNETNSQMIEQCKLNINQRNKILSAIFPVTAKGIIINFFFHREHFFVLFIYFFSSETLAQHSSGLLQVGLFFT